MKDLDQQSLSEDKTRGPHPHPSFPLPAPSATRGPGASRFNDHSMDSQGSDGPGVLGGSDHSHHSGYLPSRVRAGQRRPPPTPTREQEGEDDEEVGEGMGEEEVPWYQRQLSKMHGRQPDHLLHPRPSHPTQGTPTAAPTAAAATTTTATPATTSFRHQRHTERLLKDRTGHISAGELWDTLRQDSVNKLISNDLKFPPELKSAFSSFVRERLKNHQTRPVERSFRASEDVPDIERLLDQSRLRRIRLGRHRAGLMYRSSQTNANRTAILLHASPLPEVTEMGRPPEGISHYLPSWDPDDVSEVSEAEYMKWIRPKRQQAEGGTGPLPLEEGPGAGAGGQGEEGRRSAHSRQLSETTGQLHSLWQTIAAGKPKPRTPRYHFLTEKEASCAGEFSQRFLEEKERKEKPQAHSHPHPFGKAHSALDFAPGHRPSLDATPAATEVRTRGRSALAGQMQCYRSDWEPLSLHALAEYKQKLHTNGAGDFEHGRMKMWSAASSG